MQTVPDEIYASATLARDRVLATTRMADVVPLLHRFMREAPGPGGLDGYKVFSPAADAILAVVREKAGDAATQVFLRAAILHGIASTIGDRHLDQLPARVAAQQLRQFNRIVADQDDSPWLTLDHDLFHKEFGIATLRLYVAGARLVDPRCGVPRSLLVRGAPADWLRSIGAIASIGGFRPFFQIHTHKFMLETFGEDGSNECYRCCAELYDLHPDVLGMFGSSWFYDPALATISPHLAYLRKVPLGGGAKLLYVASGGEAINNSLAKSATRRQLHEQGRYQPQTYMLIWGKRRQQAWARAFPSSPQRAG